VRSQLANSLSHLDFLMIVKRFTSSFEEENPKRPSDPLRGWEIVDQLSEPEAEPTVLIFAVVLDVAFNAAVSNVESNSIISPIRVAVRTIHSTVTAPLSLCRNDFILKWKFIILLCLPPRESSCPKYR